MKNRLFIINESSDSKVIGKEYPQFEIFNPLVEDGLDVLSRNKGQEVKNNIEIFNLKLPTKSKITDILSCSLGAGGDFIISKKVFSILGNFKCSSVQFFPISFMHKNQIYSDFFYVHFIYAFEKFLNFKESTYDEYFINGINDNKPLSYDEFSKLIGAHKKYNHFRLTKTVLSPSFPSDEHLFVLSFANQKKYISEELYFKLIDENVSGLDYTLADDII